ncbi:unnamed protein product [Calypogeia fissa]
MASPLTSTQAEKAKIDQIVSEFFAKSLHIILESRIPYIPTQSHPEDTSHHSAASASTSTTNSPSSRSTNRWFNIEMDNCASVIDSVEPWKRGSVEPMVVDILLQQPMGGGDIPSPSGVGPPRYFKGTSPSRGNSSGDSWSGEGEGCVSPGGLSRTLLERWVIQYVPRKKGGGAVGGSGSMNRLVIGFGGEGQGGGGGCASGSKGAGKGTGGGGGPPLPYPSSHIVERPVVYKRTVIMLRSLYCTMRTLPAHRLFRLVNSSSHSRSFSLSYRVSSLPTLLSESDEAAMMTCILTPVETMWGRLCISVGYRHTTAVTALEITPPMLPRIIQDYVGSPTTDPLRRFSNVGSLPGAISSRRGVHVISLPSSVPSSPSGPSFGRRHSWSGGLQKFPPALTATPSFRASRSPSPSQPCDFNPSPPMPSPSPYSSSPSKNLPHGLSPRTSPSRPSVPRPHTAHPVSLHHVGRDNLSQPIPIHDRGRSPHFSPSPSPSPPTPSHVAPPQEGGYPHVRSAPVSIPRPSSARPSLGSSPRLLLTEGPPQPQIRSQYPPPSPSRNVDVLPRALTGLPRGWTGQQVQNLFIPSLEGRVAPRLSISTLAESSLLVSPPHPYHQAGEERGEDGPPSGVKRSLYAPPRLITLGSRSSKIGSQDDADEQEFSWPFAVDDDEAEEYISRYRSRMESPQGRHTADAFEQAHQRSQDAAVGALVRILKSAPPLRHRSPASPVNSGSPSPRHSLPPSIGSHVGSMGSGKLKNSPPLPTTTRSRSGTTSLVGSPSSQLLGAGKISPKTSRAALDELRGYVEMRDHLLRQSGVEEEGEGEESPVGF